MHKAEIISVYIQKGGCGKTTTAATLGVLLARRGYRTLLVDCDPQANLSTTFGADTSAPGLYEVFTARESDYKPSQYTKTIADNLDIITADSRMRELDAALAGRLSREKILRKFLERRLDVHANYDVVLLDCPPSSGVLPLNALAASDGILVPITAEYLSLDGFVQLSLFINEVKEEINPSLEMLGVLITRFGASRRGMKKSHKDIEAALESQCGPLLFNTRIRENARIMDAPRYGMTVVDYAPDSNGAADYEAFAQEFLDKTKK